MRKRFLAVLFAFCMALTLLPEAALAANDTPTSGKCGDNINWFLQNDGTLVLDGNGRTYDYGWYAWTNPAPWAELADQIKYIKLQGRITCLGVGLFEECREAKGITLTKYLERINDLALPTYGQLQYFLIDDNSGEFVVHDHVLYCDHGKTLYMYPPRLTSTSFTLPSGVKYISSFGNNGYLQTVVLSDGLFEIGDGTFQNCFSLKEIEIPSSVTRIGGCAFDKCRGLEKLEIPSGVTEMDLTAFWYCDKLEPVVIPASVKTVTADYTPPDGVAMDYDAHHRDFYFCGDAPFFDFDGELSMAYVDDYPTAIRTDIYYPVNASGWQNAIRPFEDREDIRFIPYDPDTPDDGQLHGTVTAIPTYAASGETVTLRVTPDPGYQLALLEVTDNDGMRPVSLSGGGSTYTFPMPAYDVTVRAKFTKI